jgi:hypothetical protein
MRVEQAIFTSTRSARVQGYHLAARSSGIDDELGRILTRWAPSHGALASSEPEATSLNCHPVGDRWLAVSRTAYGGPEYSARGGLELFTRFLLVRPDQLDGYDNNPLAFARVAIALGHMRFEPEFSGQLPPIELPRDSLSALGSSLGGDGACSNLRHTLAGNGRAAVVGDSNPVASLANLLRHTVRRERLELSFTTGLKPSLHRPFRLQFLSTIDAVLRRQLIGQGIAVISATG